MAAIGTYTLVKEMVAHGLSESAAEDIVNNFATQEQLKELEAKVIKPSEFQEAINLLRSDMAAIKNDIAGVKIEIAQVRTEIANSKADIIKWLAGLIISTAAVIVYFISK